MAHYDPDYYHILTKLPILSAKQPGTLLFSTLDIFLFCLYIITLAKLFLFGEIKMNELLKKIRQKDASAFTHSGKIHADDVQSFVVIKYPKTLTASYSTLGAADMTITRKTAASVKMASLTRHSAFSGKNLVPKSWGKSLLLSLTKLLSSHWIIMIIPVKKMNWLH